MRRVPKVLLWVAAVFLVAVVALVIIAVTIDPDAYRPAVQRELTQALGRDVSIERLSFGLSLRPTLSLRGLRIANPSWASRPHLLTAQHGAVRVDLIALWRGRIQIDQLTMEGVDLLLERDGSGAANWDQLHQEGVRLPAFDAISLQDVRVGWRDAEGATTSAQIDSATAVVRADRPFALQARATYRQTPLAVDLKANTSLHDALDGKPITAAIGLQAADAQFKLDIAIAKPFVVDSIAVAANGGGKQLSALSAIVGAPLPAWGRYQVSTRANIVDGGVRLTDLKLAIDGLPAIPKRVEVVSGEALLSRQAPLSMRLTGRLDETDFSLEATTAALPQLAQAAGPIPLSGRLALGGFTLAAHGSLEPQTEATAFDLAIEAEGDLAAPARFLGLASFRRSVLVALSAQIAGTRQQFSAKRLRGNVAGCTVAGDLLLEAAPGRRLTGALSLGRLDVDAFALAPAPSTRPSRKASDAGVSDWLSAGDADLRLRVQRIVGLPVQASDLSVHGVVRAGRLSLREFRVALAGTRLAGDGELKWQAARPYLDASIRVPTFDLAKLSAPESGAQPERGLDRPLPLAPLRAIDGDLQIEVGRIDGTPFAVDSLRASARLARGRLTVSPLQVRLAGVSAQSTLALDAASDDARVNAKVTAPSVDLADLLRKLGSKAIVSGTLGPAELTMQTHGATARTWLAQAQVNLEVGASTLRLGEEGEEARVEQVSAAAAPDRPAQARVRGSVRATPFDLSIIGGPLSELLAIERAWPKIAAELRTTVRKQPIRFAAVTGPLERLITGRAVPIDLEATTDGARAKVTGVIADLHDPSRSPLHADISVASLSRVPLLLVDSPMPDVPLTLSATVRVDARSLSAEALILRSGATRLIGTAGFALKGRMKLSAALVGDALDLRPWLPQRASSSEPVGLGKLLGLSVPLDRPTPVEMLREVDASLRLQVARLLAPGLELNDYKIDGRLDDGLLAVTHAIAEGKTQVYTRLDVRGEIPVAALRIGVQDLDLEALKLTDGVAAGADLPRISLNAELAGLGATLRQMNASAKGAILVTAGPGRVRAVASPLVIQDVFVNLLNVLTPGRRPDDYSDLECAAARFDIADGVATSPDGIALRFRRMDILGSGAINLSTGELLFGFKAVHRQLLSFSPIGLASDFAKISGTLDQPKVGLDAEDVLVKGTAAWATLGISLLATDLLRKLRATQDPCAQIVAKGRTAGEPLDALIQALPLPGRKPPAQPSAPSRPAQ